ncbi:MAG TPA: hypothetical protein VIP05_31235, partial [Burkholderiaceae bacterium]
MNPHRLLPLALVAALTAPALAAAASAQEDRLLEIEAARAPLALSGDGAWRLHVDAHDVLHRTSLADPAQASTLQLPPGVQLLSTSSDGRRLAIATRRQCVGLVDFGTQPGAAPTLSWRPWIANAEGVPLGPDDGAWTSRMPADCGGGPQAAPVAISSDGRLVATPDAVIDPATGRVLASLPSARSRVLRLQFVDHDARLLMAVATLPAPDAPARGSLGFSVWDLASKALVNDIELPDAPLAARAALEVDFSPQTGALFAVDERRRALAQQASASAVPPPLELVQFAPGACGTAPRVRAPVPDDLGAAFVVDPYGRWIASARPLDAAHDAAELAMGARSVLVVQDLASGRQLARVTSKYALDGLAATPGGDRLFALAVQPVEPETGEAIAGWPAVPDDERLVELALPAVALGATRDAARAWDAGVCREPGETPGARALARADRVLKPLWSRELGTDASPAAPQPCASAASGAAVFRTADGGLWLDLGAQVARLDPATGTTSTGLVTPRSKNVCSVVTPAGTGFLNAGGDTLTWRPLAAATDPARRRVVERRPGWTATLLPVRGDIGSSRQRVRLQPAPPVAARGLQQHQLARRQHPGAAVEAVAEVDLRDLALQRQVDDVQLRVVGRDGDRAVDGRLRARRRVGAVGARGDRGAAPPDQARHAGQRAAGAAALRAERAGAPVVADGQRQAAGVVAGRGLGGGGAGGVGAERGLGRRGLAQALAVGVVVGHHDAVRGRCPGHARHVAAHGQQRGRPAGAALDDAAARRVGGGGQRAPGQRVAAGVEKARAGGRDHAADVLRARRDQARRRRAGGRIEPGDLRAEIQPQAAVGGLEDGRVGCRARARLRRGRRGIGAELARPQRLEQAVGARQGAGARRLARLAADAGVPRARRVARRSERHRGQRQLDQALVVGHRGP